MAFFDDIGKKITQAGQGAVQKGKDMAESARINSVIAEEEKKINNYYYQIGRLYAQLHREDYEQDFSQLFYGLKDSEDKCQSLKKELSAIKGTQKCPKCGAEVPLNSSFCNICGSAVQTVDASASSKIKCTKCGNLIEPGMKFCTRCGAPVDVASAGAPAPIPNPEPESVQNIEPAAPETELSAPDTVNEEPASEQKIQGGKVCPSCGYANDDDVCFCIECGTKLD